MTLAAHEQYILELINRGRLDPLAEAARFGISLNEGLAPGTISSQSKQVVAHNTVLERAALDHSRWMLDSNTFSHTGEGGSTVYDRVTDAGYTFSGPLQTYGENLAYGGTTGVLNMNAEAEVRYDNLFMSAGHRANTLNDDYREVGIAHEYGRFNQYNTSMLTENFATSGTDLFVTGVAYTDTNGNDFYNIGEGRGDIRITANGQSAQTEAAGGYGIGIQPDATTSVTVQQGNATLGTLALDVSEQNAKLDVIYADGVWQLAVSASTDLGTGIGRAVLLGTDNLDLDGHGGNNHLTGNRANNDIHGRDGNDVIFGRGGNDILSDGAGSDRLHGGFGNDRYVLAGDGQSDIVQDWGNGNDTLDIRAWSGVAGLKDLSITQTSNGAVIRSESEELTLISANGAPILLAADDFIFGTRPSEAQAPEAWLSVVVPELAEAPPAGGSVGLGDNGNNVLIGTSGTDHLVGLGGNDRLGGSTGDDSLYGGMGNDRYVVNSTGDRIGDEIGYSQGGGIDTIEAWIDTVLPRNVEILRLMGTEDLNGGGGWAPETLVGNVGENILNGGGGNDRIVAKEGDDILVGGLGADTLEGNAGADTIVLTSADDSRAGRETRDFIHGFTHGEDKIDMTRVDANTLVEGHQSFEFIGNVAFSGTGASSAGEVRYFTFGGLNHNIVEADTDGDGVADIQMYVYLTDWMAASDFIF